MPRGLIFTPEYMGSKKDPAAFCGVFCASDKRSGIGSILPANGLEASFLRSGGNRQNTRFAPARFDRLSCRQRVSRQRRLSCIGSHALDRREKRCCARFVGVGAGQRFSRRIEQTSVKARQRSLAAIGLFRMVADTSSFLTRTRG